MPSIEWTGILTVVTTIVHFWNISGVQPSGISQFPKVVHHDTHLKGFVVYGAESAWVRQASWQRLHFIFPEIERKDHYGFSPRKTLFDVLSAWHIAIEIFAYRDIGESLIQKIGEIGCRIHRNYSAELK